MKIAFRAAGLASLFSDLKA